jgi:hypothetical protein
MMTTYSAYIPVPEPLPVDLRKHRTYAVVAPIDKEYLLQHPDALRTVQRELLWRLAEDVRRRCLIHIQVRHVFYEVHEDPPRHRVIAVVKWRENMP